MRATDVTDALARYRIAGMPITKHLLQGGTL